MTARVAEIFESIQGEGLLVGCRNIFLRFSGCNLRCSYCDTPAALEISPFCRVDKAPGKSETWDCLPNPLSVGQVLEAVSQYSSRWISLTGGEPLLWSDFIAALGIRLKPQGFRFLLETNGTLYKELGKCLSYIDLISMDYKLPAATGADKRASHLQFLAQAVHKPVYVKIVIDAEVKWADVEDAVGIIASISPDIPLILQPVTPCGGAAAPGNQMLLDLQKMCMQKIEDVRVIPQVHKLMGLI